VVDQAKKIVIVGGGSAGWLTASLMAKKWGARGFDITLIESPDIGVIGVGEGSTPPLREFFQLLDIKESEWMPECNATYKNGIRFDHWCTKPGFKSYFHPFVSGLDVFSLHSFEYNTLVRRRGIDVEAHPDKFFLTSFLAEKRLAPIPHQNFPFKVDYGYHFDSILLGRFLRKKMIAMGVNHIEAKIVDVIQRSNGDISSLTTEDGKMIEGDFYVDCTGFIGVLIQKTLKVPFVSFSDNLFNDSAVTIPSTIDRFGNGYVYSSGYCSSDDAETELRTHIGLLDSDVEARHIKMNVGRLVKNWSNNCVAIGLSQGFIEPLEATAIQLVLSSAQKFMNEWEDGDFTNKNRDIYNANIQKDFESIRDYIVLHYKSNSRDDTQYWKDNFENPHISDSLKNMISCWLECGDIAAEIERQGIKKYYASISWHAIFAGMGIFPDEDKLGRGTLLDYQMDLHKIRALLDFSTQNFDPQSQFLASKK